MMMMVYVYIIVRDGAKTKSGADLTWVLLRRGGDLGIDGEGAVDFLRDFVMTTYSWVVVQAQARVSEFVVIRRG